MPGTHSSLLNFKNKQLHDQTDMESQSLNVINVQCLI